MHLVGFIIRIYHDARSPERQILSTVLLKPTSLLLFSVCTVLTNSLSVTSKEVFRK